MSAVALPWRQFICRACGFIYDEELGDPDGGLAPGTRFEDIPDDWACPLCGVSKHDFDPYTPPSGPRVPTPSETGVHVASRRGEKGVVIVGGGLAGWSVARALRARDPDKPITLVAADRADVYSKPALSLAFGKKRRTDDLVDRSGQETAHALGVRLVTDAYAVGIDAPRRRLRTTRGTLAYDALVLATGARPVESRSLPSALCWRINALDAWSRLDDVLAGGPRRVTVIGAGLVGCEIADDLAHAQHHVTVIDPAARPLAAWATDDESTRLLDGWKALGIAFMGSRAIHGVSRDAEGPTRVTLDDGAVHETDVVIAAIGLTTDKRLADSAGLRFENGIAVDCATHLTSDDAIYAAGDCVSIEGKPCRFIEPIARQAETIAAAITDAPSPGHVHRMPLVRLKARSAPMTLAGR